MNLTKKFPIVPVIADNSVHQYFVSIKSVFDSTVLDLNKIIKELYDPGTGVAVLLADTHIMVGDATGYGKDVAM